MDLRAETGTPNDDRSSIYRMSFCISLSIDFCLRLRFYSSAESDFLASYRFLDFLNVLFYLIRYSIRSNVQNSLQKRKKFIS